MMSRTIDETTFTTPHMPTTVGTAAQTYDTNGNFLTDGTNTLTWDYKGRVKTITEGADTYTYLYDHEGNRVKETKGTGSTVFVNPYYTLENGTIETHIFAEGEVIGSIKNVSGVSDLCLLTQTSLLFTLTPETEYTKVTENGNIVVKRGNETAVTVSPNTEDTRCKKTQHTHLYTDALGSTIAGINKEGTVTQTIDYYPYGEKHTETATTDSLYTHTGNITDETDFIYRNARYYDPNKGLFISKDPVIEYIGGPVAFEAATGVSFLDYLTNPQAHHTYAYAMNNPLRYEDRDGELAHIAIGVTVGVLVGAGSQVITDVIAGEVSEGYKYIAATAGGATTGGLVVGTSLLAAIIAGTAGGVVRDSIEQGWEMHKDPNQEFNFARLSSRFFESAVFSGIGKYIKISGITSGSNSFSAVYSSTLTKLSNGNVSIFGVSATTGLKGFVAETTRSFPKSFYSGVGRHIETYQAARAKREKISYLIREITRIKRQIAELQSGR